MYFLVLQHLYSHSGQQMSISSRDVSGEAGPPRKRGRGRRRARVRSLNEAEAARVDFRVRETTMRSRSLKTLMIYDSCMKNINEWYWKNEQQLCTADKVVDDKLIRRLCKTRTGLVKQSKIFKRMLMSKEHETDKLADGSPAPARAGTLSAYRSAWANYIWQYNLPENEITGIPHEWDATMSGFFKGLKNDEANRRQTGLLPLKEGKAKMNVTLFRLMSDHFHKEGDVVSVHNHNWSWNLMCRSFNVSNMFAQHLGWGGDCISLQYGQTKTMREGGKRNLTAMLKHLFANPFEPRVRTPHSYSQHIHACRS